jgi:4-alpha-glucanotransferase
VTGPDPDAWGIAPGYHDVKGRWVPAPATGVAAALAAMEAETERPSVPTTVVVEAGEVVQAPSPGVLVTEDGGTERVEAGPLPPLPLGYHRLELGSGPIDVIVSPGRCILPGHRTWGWAVQLYAARSARSWGMGDLADLACMARWAAESGAGLILVNPLHAVAPTPKQEPSPYYPTSRRWRSPLYLDVDAVLAEVGLAGNGETGRARALNDVRAIDRDAVWSFKGRALERAWTASNAGGASFASWADAQGPTLTTFATYCVLSERHGADWRAWPAELRRHDAPAVGRFVDSAQDRVRYHCWLQWLVDVQLARAATAGAPLVGDLAIGADPGGADAWEWQDVTARDVSLGAPPDEFVTTGQDWGFPPFDPWRLRRVGYRPFVELVRRALTHVAGLRIDHVLGLFRQFWVPAGRPPGEGVYVRLPWSDLCRVLALESHRAGAYVIGEDLGTVEPWVRGALAKHDVLSYRLLLFEDEPPRSWAERALAVVTTHDLPTIRGLRSGADATERRGLGFPVDEEADAGPYRRLEAVLGLGRPAVDAHRAIGESPCLLAVSTLEDALGVVERPNLPGATAPRRNWCLALPEPLEAVITHTEVMAVAGALAATRAAPARSAR